MVESSGNSITFQVCRVASGAKETRRLAMDLRLAARCANAASFCALRCSSASRSRAASCCSSSVRRATVWPRGLFLVMGLKGSCDAPCSLTETRDAAFEGPGVEKSIRRSSTAAFAGDLPLPVLLFRSSSKLGIAFGGVKGIVGFSIDRGVNIELCTYQSSAEPLPSHRQLPE